MKLRQFASQELAGLPWVYLRWTIGMLLSFAYCFYMLAWLYFLVFHLRMFISTSYLYSLQLPCLYLPFVLYVPIFHHIPCSLICYLLLVTYIQEALLEVCYKIGWMSTVPRSTTYVIFNIWIRHSIESDS